MIMGRKSSLDVLPQDVRRWLERALTERNFTGYAELEELLKDKGFVITRSSLQRFGYRMEQQLARVRAATEAARLMAREASDDGDDRSGGLVALIQTEMIDILMRLKELDGDDPKESSARAKLMATVSKNIATLTRASINLKKYQAEWQKEARDALLREQQENLKAVARERGMDKESVDFWKRRVLGVS
ncbi:DUF3486 family protein [Salmonella enterica subsp. enterica]|nr:DUF3486 family protein [Salmonella enterica subsp. enterica]